MDPGAVDFFFYPSVEQVGGILESVDNRQIIIIIISLILETLLLLSFNFADCLGHSIHFN